MLYMYFTSFLSKDKTKAVLYFLLKKPHKNIIYINLRIKFTKFFLADSLIAEGPGPCYYREQKVWYIIWRPKCYRQKVNVPTFSKERTEINQISKLKLLRNYQCNNSKKYCHCITSFFWDETATCIFEMLSIHQKLVEYNPSMGQKLSDVLQTDSYAWRLLFSAWYQMQSDFEINSNIGFIYMMWNQQNMKGYFRIKNMTCLYLGLGNYHAP